MSDMSPREMLHGTMEGHIGDSILNLACLNQGKEQIGQADVILKDGIDEVCEGVYGENGWGFRNMLLLQNYNVYFYSYCQMYAQLVNPLQILHNY